MIRISTYAEAAALPLREHGVFERLARGSRASFAAMAPGFLSLTFTWQEVLRINAERAVDPTVREICTQARADERNHDRWLVHDISVLRPELSPDILWIHANERSRARDACYDLLAEVTGTCDDWSRVTVMMAMEAGSKIFFSTIMPILTARGWTEKLAYFSPHHLESEFAHDMYHDEFYDKLRSCPLDDAGLARHLALVDRIHAALRTIVDEAERLVVNARVDAPPPSLPRARRPSYVA